MKKQLVIIFLLLAIIALVLAQNKNLRFNQSAEQQLQRTHQEFIESAAKGDVKKMEKLLAEDYFATGVDGKTSDKSHALEAAKQNGPHVEMKEEDVRARIYGPSGVITGLINWKVIAQDKTLTGKVRFTEIWTLQNKQWKLSVSQATTAS